MSGLLVLSVTVLALSWTPVCLALSPCFNFAFTPHTVCNSDPNSPEYLRAAILRGRGDRSCPIGGLFEADVRYRDGSGQIQSTRALRTSQVEPRQTGPVQFDFDIPQSSIDPAYPVTIGITVRNEAAGASFSTDVTYFHRHDPTVTFSPTATTVTLASSSTETFHLEVFAGATSFLTPDETITVSGVCTVTDQRRVAKITSTYTPDSKVVNLLTTETVTIPMACLPEGILYDKSKLGRLTDRPIHNTPFCGPQYSPIVVPTTTSTFTQVLQFLDIATQIVTSSTTWTSTLPTPTVCQEAASATTVTIHDALSTSTEWVLAPRATTTFTSRSFETVMVYPNGPEVCAAYPDSNLLRISTDIALPSGKARGSPSKKPKRKGVGATSPPSRGPKPQLNGLDDAGDNSTGNADTSPPAQRQGSPEALLCPKANGGKYYSGTGGAGPLFVIQCFRELFPLAGHEHRDEVGFQECVEWCGAMPECRAVVWRQSRKPRPGLAGRSRCWWSAALGAKGSRRKKGPFWGAEKL